MNKQNTEAEIEEHFNRVVEMLRLARIRAQAGVSAEEKAAILKEKFEDIGFGMREDDRLYGVERDESRMLGEY